MNMTNEENLAVPESTGAIVMCRSIIYQSFQYGKHLFGFHNKYCKKAVIWALPLKSTDEHKQLKGPYCTVTGREF